MEKSKTNAEDIYGSILERINSPLIFSFILSFLMINWNVLVLLIIYTPDTFYRDYCNDIMSYVNQNISIGYPIFASIIFTFGYPFVRIVISFISAYANTKRNNVVLKRYNKAKINFETYFKLLEESEQSKKRLSDLITQNEAFLKQKDELVSNLNTLEKEKGGLIYDLNQLNNQLNTKFIRGDWLVELTNKNKKILIHSLTLNINNDHVNILENNTQYKVFEIEMMFLDIRNNYIVLSGQMGFNNSDVVLRHFAMFNMLKYESQKCAFRLYATNFNDKLSFSWENNIYEIAISRL